LEPISQILDAVYRTESRRVFATLVRILGDFDLAEEALHEAFASALEQWPRDGVPENPRAWLVSTGRFRGVNVIRRLESVLDVVYLVFNEGYSASSGDSLTRVELSAEAIRLGRLVVELLPDPDAFGLLALMLLHESRRPARASADGELILLDKQDRTHWDRAMIAEGRSVTERALEVPSVGTFAIQAAIAAVHADADNPVATDWRRIAAWYDLQLRADPSPVVELNRAVAVALRDGPEAGLAQPYLFFGGRCEEALEHYRTAIGAQVEMVLRFSESPEQPPPGMPAPGFESKIMHCSFKVGGSTIMASDGCGPGATYSGFSLALSLATEAEAEKAFAALADGGAVKMPLVKTFWSPLYGQLVDRFGIEWMVMVAL